MQPSPSDILRGCVQNLEELVIPEVKSAHARSAIGCVRMMLNHVALRLEQEPRALVADSAEKRALFEGLLAEGLLGDAEASVRAALEDARGPLRPVLTEDLAAENDRWKVLTEELLCRIGHGDARRRIRAQLRAQADREAGYTAAALDGPLF